MQEPLLFSLVFYPTTSALWQRFVRRDRSGLLFSRFFWHVEKRNTTPPLFMPLPLPPLVLCCPFFLSSTTPRSGSHVSLLSPYPPLPHSTFALQGRGLPLPYFSTCFGSGGKKQPFPPFPFDGWPPHFLFPKLFFFFFFFPI